MNGIEWTTELRFLVALSLGFLVGLERETARRGPGQHVFVGVRTYTIMALYGFACAWLARHELAAAVPAGMLTIAAFALAGYLTKLRDGHVGWTSEVSAALTFVIGVLALLADVWIPMALGVVTTLFLSEKSEFERLVDRLDKNEFLAVLKFLLVTVIILPVLPNREYPPFALNPSRIWQIVILVSSIGFAGYFLVKRIGPRSGLRISGLLGGIVSSTAVCVAMGRLARKREVEPGAALQASLLASSVMYLRILALIWILNPALLGAVWWRLALLAAAGVALALATPRAAAPSDAVPAPALWNPFEIRPALLFALVFVALSIGTQLVRGSFGDHGLLALSVAVGVSDIDPFILSLLQGAQAAAPVALQAMLLAMLSNTLVKGAYLYVLVAPLRRATLWRFCAWGALHLPALLLP